MPWAHAPLSGLREKLVSKRIVVRLSFAPVMRTPSHKFEDKPRLFLKKATLRPTCMHKKQKVHKCSSQIHTQTQLKLHVLTLANAHTCLHALTHTHKNTQTHTKVYTCMQIHTRAYNIHTHILTHAHTLHIYERTRTQHVNCGNTGAVHMGSLTKQWAWPLRPAA